MHVALQHLWMQKKHNLRLLCPFMVTKLGLHIYLAKHAFIKSDIINKAIVDIVHPPFRCCPLVAGSNIHRGIKFVMPPTESV